MSFRLFKFKPKFKNLGLDEDEEKKSIDDFAIKLKYHALFKSQKLIFNKFINLTHFIKPHPNAQGQLKE